MELKSRMAKAFFLLLLSCSAAWGRPLLVVSIDGLDHRYLRDRDELGLKIPTLRRLLAQAQWADHGVIGVMPTVTFPSHTSMMTGVAPQIHGIVDNNQANGERYWFSSFLKVPTLWDAAKKAGKTVGAVHWPVTVGSAIDYDFPEHYKRKQGAGMDWEASVEKSTPGLVDRMAARYPSVATQWVDDRTRSTAAMFILQEHKPDLMLVHLIDHDAEAHQAGPFTQHAKAMLELLDDYLARIVAAMPNGMALALVSDHGFERIDKVANPWDLLKHAGVTGQLQSYGTHLTTNDPAVAEAFRKQAGFREIPASEWERFLPGVEKPLAAFEAPPHTELTRTEKASSGPKAKPSGSHGFWPTRGDYRSTYLLWGPGVQRAMLGEIDMLSIAGRLARVLDVPFGKD
ncbi:MAG: alkaline phosphatase family protein [Bryobacterales bacterium]|nr:alkaline phosphatase family protein [Bryobacterales bacterium]